jgi:hypothetical protein
MKLIKLFFLFLFLSIKGFSQQAVLTSSGDKVILNFLSSSGGTITGTLGVTGNTTISGTTTLTGVNNTGTITNTGALINTGNLTVNGNGTITGTLTLPSLAAETLLGTNGSSQIGTVSLTGDITTTGLVATLSNTGVISGTYGSSSAIPLITVDSKGRITTITTTAITATGGSTITYTIGSYPELGGYVFYVTPNGMHGLVAETKDQYTSTPTCSWYAAQDEISKPANHSAYGQKFTDWRLPTKYELNLMYNAKSDIGGFANFDYWSSTEVASNDAWFQDFLYGGQNPSNKDSPFCVRAIRAF